MVRLPSVILLFLFALPFWGLAQTEVPYTLEDRDRLIRLEERVASVENQVQSLRNEMNTRFESMEIRFASLEKTQDMILTLMIFMLGAMVALSGFVLWDRRAAIRPLQFDVKNVEARNAQIITALREQALKDPDLAEVLKKTGILL